MTANCLDIPKQVTVLQYLVQSCAESYRYTRVCTWEGKWRLTLFVNYCSFSTLIVCCRVFHSRVFHPCDFECAAFSTTAFSVASVCYWQHATSIYSFSCGIMFMQVSFCTCKMKVEAGRLKSVTRTKVVALGIGSGVTQAELNNVASAPLTRNVIRVRDFSSLTTVEEQLRNVSCTGQWLSVISYF